MIESSLNESATPQTMSQSTNDAVGEWPIFVRHFTAIRCMGFPNYTTYRTYRFYIFTIFTGIEA